MRLIDANALNYTKVAEVNGVLTHVLTAEDINNTPTVEVAKIQSYTMGFSDGLKAQTYEKPPMFEKPQGDLISRDYVEKIIVSEVVDLQDGTEEWRTYVNDTCENILNKVHNASTVEPNQLTQDLIDKVNVNIGLAQPINEERPHGEWITIADVMSVFDDFMRGDISENDTEEFLEMLKDKIEQRGEEE